MIWGVSKYLNIEVIVFFSSIFIKFEIYMMIFLVIAATEPRVQLQMEANTYNTMLCYHPVYSIKEELMTWIIFLFYWISYQYRPTHSLP